MNVRASVLIPAHNKATTLPLTVDTVLRQSVHDLEVIVIGDGVTWQVREVVLELQRSDSRVRFLDFEKGPHHGEHYRHDAIAAAESDAILYLCDDDLLLPDHVADLLELLGTHTFVQSLNGFVTPAGDVRLTADDLSDPESITLHLRDDLLFNSVSITGTGHSRRLYDRVDRRWETTPAGALPDHHQFRKMFAHPDFRGATSRRMTALQFPTSSDGRDTWTDEQRTAELEPWHRLVLGNDAQRLVDERVVRGAIDDVMEHRRRYVLARHDLSQTHAACASLRRDLADVTTCCDALRDDLAEVNGHCDTLRLDLANEHQVLEDTRTELETLRRRARRLRQRLDQP